MDLKTQKRMAAEILNVGKNKVWMDSDRMTEISTAITKDDIRRLIDQGAIKAKDKKSVSRARARKRDEQRKKGKQSGPGTRKGAKNGRKSNKEKWMQTVRAQRELLKELRDSGKLDSRTYRDLYNKVKGGAFRSKGHLETYLKDRELLEDD